MSTHFDPLGHPHMVDISGKPITARTAVAEAIVKMEEATLLALRSVSLAKGDVLAVARLAAIHGSKLTSHLIPLCHAIPIEAVEVQFSFLSTTTVSCRVTVKTTSRTGVEMEALTAASVAGLTIYDMCKSIDRTMEIGPIRLLSKHGGASGDFQRSP